MAQTPIDVLHELTDLWNNASPEEKWGDDSDIGVRQALIHAADNLIADALALRETEAKIATLTRELAASRQREERLRAALDRLRKGEWSTGRDVHDIARAALADTKPTEHGVLPHEFSDADGLKNDCKHCGEWFYIHEISRPCPARTKPTEPTS